MQGNGDKASEQDPPFEERQGRLFVPWNRLLSLRVEMECQNMPKRSKPIYRKVWLLWMRRKGSPGGKCHRIARGQLDQSGWMIMSGISWSIYATIEILQDAIDAKIQKLLEEQSDIEAEAESLQRNWTRLPMKGNG